MKQFFLLLLLGGMTIHEARAQKINPINERAAKSFDGIRGFADYVLSSSERINVNYSMSPKSPSSSVHFTLSTANPMRFRVIIRNEAGKVVLDWSPEQVSHSYILDWDITRFSPGNYNLDIYGRDDAASFTQLAFTKL